MTSDGRKVAYIIGAISSDPNYEAKFADAATVLMNLGFAVLYPTLIPPYLTYEGHMWCDFVFVDECDVLVPLPDWVESSGANREMSRAIEQKKEVVFYKNILTYAHERGMIPV